MTGTIRFMQVFLAAILVPQLASAQRTVGTVASTAGAVEVQRGGKGDWEVVTVGTPVAASDGLRTGPNGLVRVVFEDGAVVSAGAATVLRVERYATGRAPRRSLLRLEQGTLEALVGGPSGEAAQFEIETPTAVVRAHATAFVVRYNPADRATEVVTLEGSVSVQGTTAIIGPAAIVAANSMTRVPADGFPSPAEAVRPAQLAEYTRGLQVVGTGGRDGLDVGNALLEGRVVGPDDRPGVAVAAAPTPAAQPYLQPDVPGQTLLQTLSPDMRANTQPLPQYRRVKPNEAPLPPH